MYIYITVTNMIKKIDDQMKLNHIFIESISQDIYNIYNNIDKLYIININIYILILIIINTKK